MLHSACRFPTVLPPPPKIPKCSEALHPLKLTPTQPMLGFYVIFMWAILHWNHLEKQKVYTQDSNNQSTVDDMHPSTHFLIVHKKSDAEVLVLTSILYPSACNPFVRVNMYRECAPHARFGHTCKTITEINHQTLPNSKKHQNY